MIKLFESLLRLTLRQARRLVIALIGGTVVLVGLIMIFTPGPALVVIPVGLAILAVEFVWARRLLRRIRINTKRQLRKLRNTRNGV
jgi:uncharacterized protein (TIGR02611 family)